MNLNSLSALLENCQRKAWAERRLRIAMAGTGGGGSGPSDDIFHFAH